MNEIPKVPGQQLPVNNSSSSNFSTCNEGGDVENIEQTQLKTLGCKQS